MIGRVGNKASLMKSKVETALESWERGRAPPSPEPPDNVPLTPFYPLLPTFFLLYQLLLTHVLRFLTLLLHNFNNNFKRQDIIYNIH